MAVHTRLHFRAVARLLEAYALGELVALEGIDQGIENTNYRIDTARGRFVLTLFERRTAENALPYLVALHDHLAARALGVPKPIRDQVGTALQRLSGKPACIFGWQTGESLGPEPDRDTCRRGGAALGALHAASADFAATRDNPFGPAEWTRLAGALAPHLDAIEPGLARGVADALARIATDWPRHLPRATIHGDLFPDNVMSDGVDITGVIDFGFACTDIRAYDLAVMLVSWCFAPDGGAYREDRADALVAGYESTHRLSDEERACLPILCLGAALRFLLTRVEDRFAQTHDASVQRKDPLAFARRLRFYAAR